MQPELPLTREIQPTLQLDFHGQRRPSNEVRSGIASITAARSASHLQGFALSAPEPDTLSSNSADLLRAQLRQVNQRLDEVQNEFIKSKDELRESSKGGSLFALEIQDELVLIHFYLPSLESYDSSSDPTEHVAAFRAQMALYVTSDMLMSRAFLTTLRGPARIWYNRLKLSSISSFNQLVKEFELNFLASTRPRPTVALLLVLSQGSDESLTQFVGRFTMEFRGVPDVHPSIAIQTFLMGLRPSRFFRSLIEHPSRTVPECYNGQTNTLRPRLWWPESETIRSALARNNPEDSPRDPQGEESTGSSRHCRGHPRPHLTLLRWRFSSKSERNDFSRLPTQSRLAPKGGTRKNIVASIRSMDMTLRNVMTLKIRLKILFTRDTSAVMFRTNDQLLRPDITKILQLARRGP
ncbi:hypothetical protein GW17_00042933 [Ensete ventricosum]|nr:hypothetical protein GW17_00042933 [Ensete ventricosum]